MADGTTASKSLDSSHHHMHATNGTMRTVGPMQSSKSNIRSFSPGSNANNTGAVDKLDKKKKASSKQPVKQYTTL